MLENDLNMIDLVLIHLTHPWPLDGLVHGTHFLWSYLVISDMPENGQKVPAQLGLWVYNSENCFVGSFDHNTCRVIKA